jgi:hypothetical protein
MIEFTLPIKTVNPTNNRQHWRTVYKRGVMEKRAAWSATVNARIESGEPLPVPAVITFTRIGAGSMDEDDNLRASIKHLKDGIALAFGIDDKDKRLEWQYAQEKAKRGVYGVRIRIESSHERR